MQKRLLHCPYSIAVSSQEVLVVTQRSPRARQNRQPQPLHLEKTGGFGTNQHQRRGAEAAGWKTSRFVCTPGSLWTVSPRKQGAFEFFCQPQPVSGPTETGKCDQYTVDHCHYHSVTGRITQN